MQRSLKWLAVVTTFVMLLVLLGGALVTKTGSELGCGNDWPLCHGQLIPEEITMETIIELSHRLVSGVAGLLVVALSVLSWRLIGHKRETKFLAATSTLFLIAQALIGAAAVKWGQSDFVLALHFGISLISFSAVLLLTLLIFEVDQKFDASSLVIDKRMKWHTIGVTLYSYLVVYTGALVRHTKASLACADWPFCLNGSPFMSLNSYQWIQMGHRLAAGLIFLWIVYITMMAIKHYKQQRVIYWGWVIACSLVSLQVISGAIIIFTKVNLYVALAHALFISCLFGLLCYLILLISRSKTSTNKVSKVS
ncbi:COX15/CtaA family protein [Bacillus badius]|uniref:Heme A synthase n=1 Tax=Bacillus badius TaxID=1455 RepID=A0ABR5B1F5_BACBA|nr:heme A synthase [Bacillus badius]KIL73437.1 Heme A synthase, cytochrome oxidase biogenesis protein Cox15-CtaA [Bacillus badius]KIL80446.1 Heme A synthase, cytochrome oxidase biogenesis protein Cox15-CtaA [Bacillus badius]KZO01550.1 heme A synthase [Bacillus badius]KZR57261.1 heme A synthase [Bacillus badius]MED0667193.1 heme A synthase [Bacillus badius]